MVHDINDPSTWAYPPRNDYDEIHKVGNTTIRLYYNKDATPESRQKIADNCFRIQLEALRRIRREDPDRFDKILASL